MAYSFAHGTGTSADPFQIWTAADLNGVRDWAESDDDSPYYFLQMANIDLSAYNPWAPIGVYTYCNFGGNYNGNGFKISNLTVNGNPLNTYNRYCGLFGNLWEYFSDTGGSPIVQNVILKNVNVSGTRYVGAICGQNQSSSNILNCVVLSGSVSGTDYVGGITGVCDGPMSNCRSLASVSADDDVGGLIGDINNDGVVVNCYAAGAVSAGAGASYVGGLAGYNGDGTVTSSYYDSTVSGQSDNDGRGVPKTTAQMKSQSTFTGWDFTNVWAIDSSVNNGYPYLRMEYPLCFQTRKRYVEVIECTSSDQDMTMHYNSKYYKFVKFLEEFAITTHPTAGVSIAYEYGGQTVEYGGKDYAFIASGITDPAGPGGYGDYKAGTSRTVKSLATRENFVHFYYIEIANADMAIHSPSEIKSANPMIILDAGVSYPIGAKYHFKLTSYADSGAVTQIATVNSKDNPEIFKYSLDEGITWAAYPVGGVANTNTKLLVAARLNVGPRAEVWILPSKELVVT